MKYQPGDCVLLILQNPREKIFGLLQDLSAAGVTVRGIDVDYFDDWSRAIASGEPYLAMNETFFPMWRVERMSRDQGSQDIPSMRELFEERTGSKLEDY